MIPPKWLGCETRLFHMKSKGLYTPCRTKMLGAIHNFCFSQGGAVEVCSQRLAPFLEYLWLMRLDVKDESEGIWGGVMSWRCKGKHKGTNLGGKRGISALAERVGSFGRRDPAVQVVLSEPCLPAVRFAVGCWVIWRCRQPGRVLGVREGCAAPRDSSQPVWCLPSYHVRPHAANLPANYYSEMIKILITD